MAETEPRANARTAAVSVRALIALVAVALVAYGIDQLSKFLVVSNLHEGETVDVVGQFVQFHFVKNPGAAFSLATGYTWIFSIAAALVTIFIIYFARRIRSVAWAVLFGMLLGGTTGNLTDRLFREPSFGLGHVVDFILINPFPAIFNAADSFICISMALFVVLTIRGTGLDGVRVRAKTAHRDDDSGTDTLNASFRPDADPSVGPADTAPADSK